MFFLGVGSAFFVFRICFYSVNAVSSNWLLFIEEGIVFRRIDCGGRTSPSV